MENKNQSKIGRISLKKSKFPVDELCILQVFPVNFQIEQLHKKNNSKDYIKLFFFFKFILFDSRKRRNICRTQSKYAQFRSRKSKHKSSTFWRCSRYAPTVCLTILDCGSGILFWIQTLSRQFFLGQALPSCSMLNLKHKVNSSTRDLLM